MAISDDVTKLETDVATLVQDAEMFADGVKTVLADLDAIGLDVKALISSNGAICQAKPGASLPEDLASLPESIGKINWQHLACIAIEGYNAAIPFIEAATGKILPPIPVPAFCTSPAPTPAPPAP